MNAISARRNGIFEIRPPSNWWRRVRLKKRRLAASTSVSSICKTQPAPIVFDECDGDAWAGAICTDNHLLARKLFLLALLRHDRAARDPRYRWNFCHVDPGAARSLRKIYHRTLHSD